MKKSIIIFIINILALIACTSNKQNIKPFSTIDSTLQVKVESIAYSGGYPFSISGDIRSVPS